MLWYNDFFFDPVSELFSKLARMAGDNDLLINRQRQRQYSGIP